MARNNQGHQTGIILTASLTGTGKAQTLFEGYGKGMYVDLLSLVLTSAAPDASVVATISDGKKDYAFNITTPLVIPFNTPLKASDVHKAWTFEAPPEVKVFAQAIATAS
jgi:hypothetical protein